jgi:hypothetical protein
VEARQFTLQPGQPTSLEPPSQIFVQDNLADPSRYCWLTLYDSQQRVTDSMQLLFYTNATVFDETPIGGYNGTGDGAGPVPGNSSACGMACPGFFAMKCFVRFRCWAKLGASLGALGGILASAGLLVLAIKLGLLGACLTSSMGMCGCAAPACCMGGSRDPADDQEDRREREREQHEQRQEQRREQKLEREQQQRQERQLKLEERQMQEQRQRQLAELQQSPPSPNQPSRAQLVNPTQAPRFMPASEPNPFGTAVGQSIQQGRNSLVRQLANLRAAIAGYAPQPYHEQASPNHEHMSQSLNPFASASTTTSAPDSPTHLLGSWAAAEGPSSSPRPQYMGTSNPLFNSRP